MYVMVSMPETDAEIESLPRRHERPTLMRQWPGCAVSQLTRSVSGFSIPLSYLGVRLLLSSA